MYETSCQSRFDARYWMLGAGALGRPRGMVWADSLQPYGVQHIRLPCPFTISRSIVKLISLELMMLSNHLILCCPLLLLPSIFPSIRVFSNESALCMRWPKYWSFSFSISLSNEYSGLIWMDWLDLLAVPGTLKSLLQHHSSKALILYLFLKWGKKSRFVWGFLTLGTNRVSIWSI